MFHISVDLYLSVSIINFDEEQTGNLSFCAKSGSDIAKAILPYKIVSYFLIWKGERNAE